MLKKFIDIFKNLDKKIKKIMHYGFTSSFIVCVLATLILITYQLYPISFEILDSGLLLFQAGITIAVSFVVCGVAFDNIQKNFVK